MWCGKSKIESKSVAPVVDHLATDDGHLVVACVTADRIVVVRVVVVFLAVTMVGKDAADRAAEARPLNNMSGRRSCSNHVALLLLPIAGDVVGVKAARKEE